MLLTLQRCRFPLVKPGSGPYDHAMTHDTAESSTSMSTTLKKLLWGSVAA